MAAYRPLAGVRVLDLGRYVLGAIVSRRLADLGADVVKVESPRGDPIRALTPQLDGHSLWHELEDRNKSSIVLDLSVEADADVVRRLTGVADVIIEAGRPDALARRGIDLRQLRIERPSLVVCSLTAFGRTSPLQSLPAHAMNVDGLAGVAASREVDGRWEFVSEVYGGLANDAAAHSAALGICAALFHARTQGTGAWLEVSSWDAAVEANRVAVSYQLATGKDFFAELSDELWGSRHRLYATADGRPIYFAAVEADSWRRFCEGVGRPDLVAGDDQESSLSFGDGSLVEELEQIFRSRPADYWASVFQAWNLAGSVVLTTAETVHSDQFTARGMRVDGAGLLPSVANPITWVETGERAGSGAASAPDLGADHDDVLERWLRRTASD